MRQRLAFGPAALAAGIVLLLAGPAAASPGPVVPTTSGAVEGVVNGAVAEWRGIPYAAPPVGALRWRPPGPAPPWAGVRDASEFATPCIQLAPDGTLGSEDCLYLNVFAPSTATSASHLAVMVHLHPGSNSGFFPYMDANAFTARDVVVVTLAYRLGVLGFVGHPALSAEGGGSSGEYGLLDQLAALRWVRDNIAAFGGDPSRVMLFGSSAGSFDTVALMASPLSAGLFARASVQGEVRWGLTGQFTGIDDAEGIGLQIAGAVGCTGAADVPACLRAVPASDLVEAAGFLDLFPWTGGVVLPRPAIELLSEHATVPLLAGFDREEDAIFQPNPLDAPYSKGKWVEDTTALVGSNFGARARALYPLSSYDSLLWSYITMLTDAKRGCPTRQLANAVAPRAPVWRWLYTHVYEDDPIFAPFRASHVLEEGFLWQTDPIGLGHVNTAAEQVLADRMTDYWTNFAKTGNPNGAGLPPWPQYNASTEPTLTLDDQIGVVGRYHAQECALLDSVPILFPFPWEVGGGYGPAKFPPAFLYGHAQAVP
jgi:para-nitrobenzyl esterase